jgi:hypothetical protein
MDGGLTLTNFTQAYLTHQYSQAWFKGPYAEGIKSFTFHTLINVLSGTHDALAEETQHGLTGSVSQRMNGI